VWEAASLSKPVFAAFVIEQFVNGDIDLDAPLSVDLEAIGAPPDRRWGHLTARHVLTHTSGLPNWRGPITGLSASGWDVDASGEQLQFKADPGQYGYSGEAFEVLLHALCRISGLGPTDLLERARQAGALSNSSFIWHPDFDERAAIPHLSGGEPLPKRRPVVGRAAGSLQTTLSDYLAFALSVMET
jgi:CubicO group peptidase (beta-lactamase class C family)